MVHHRRDCCVFSGALVVLLLFASGCVKPGELAGQENQVMSDRFDAQLIYGEDHRLQNYQASVALQTLAASTVALVNSSSLSQNAQNQWLLRGRQFGAARQLCSTEPFRDETAAAFCSGSLVGSDVVITAGHCITDSEDCLSTRFVFDFAVKSAGKETTLFSPNQVYRCGAIIKRELSASGVDYAIIRLDRKVEGRKPLKFRRQGSVQVGDPLVVIGHPAGLPQKIAGGAQVRSVQSGFFVSNLDTYGGNSGSAVFNPVTGQVEGILVRGDMDFVRQGDCYVSNRCSDSGCRGEDVTRLDVLASYIPADDARQEGAGRFFSERRRRWARGPSF